MVLLVATDSLALAGTITTAGLADAAGDGGAGTDGAFSAGTCDLEGSGGAGGAAGSGGSSAGGRGVAGYFAAGWNDCIERQCEDSDSRPVAGGHGGDGGAGAGGGVLLRAPRVSLTGTIDARGGGGNLANGGTVKIFYGGTAAPDTSGVRSPQLVLLPD
jgi:hypothetical protein